MPSIESDGHSRGNPRIYELIENAPREGTGVSPTIFAFAQFVDFLKISLRRAFHLRIEPHEVTPSERVALEKAGVTEPTFQAFLSWRRSMVFAFATLVIPLILTLNN